MGIEHIIFLFFLLHCELSQMYLSNSSPFPPADSIESHDKIVFYPCTASSVLKIIRHELWS